MKPRWISHKLASFFPPLFFSLLFSPRKLTTSSNPAFHFNQSLSVLSHVHISRLLSNCGREGNLHLGSSLHALIIKNRHYYDPRSYDDARTSIVVWNSLLFMYAKCRVIWGTVKVFDEMPKRDSVSWNSIISSFFSNGDFNMGFKYFKKIVALGIDQLDQATFTTVISAGESLGFLRVNEMVHALVILSGYRAEVTVGNALITAYFRYGCSGFAKLVFDEMNERNVITWTAVMSGLVQSGFCEDGLKLFTEMRDDGLVDPNSLTYLSLLLACSDLQALREGREIHGLVLKLGYHSDLCTESALMDMYSKCGIMEDALQIFYSADKLDEVSMTVILAGLAQNGFEEEAIQVFVQMIKSGIDIDPNTVSAILGVFGSDTSLAFGQQIHSLVIKKSFGANTYVSNGLINMYSKCGTLEDSTKLFHRMPQRNSVSWNSIIAAFARHGDGLKAIQLYDEMSRKGIEPTDITFLSLLHACSHIGLVKKGMEFFESMSKVHLINPRMEHYACVVDMLGRARLISEAKNFIDQLPVKPGILVWQALLGACAIHGESELGKYAAEQLLLLAPENPAPYVQLANIFSSERKWSDRARTIKRLKESGLAKETGISWIEIEKKVHSFVVCDRMHPQIQVVYSVVAQMFLHLVDEGYKPDKRFILNYFDQDEEVLASP